MASTTRYDRQRTKRTPPHVSLGDLRAAVGITLDQLIQRIEDTSGITTTRGTLSAIENGLRGGSAELLTGIALAYGLRPDAITTDYLPRAKGEAA